VTAGLILQRKVDSIKAVSDVSLHVDPARRSASSASRAVARRRSGMLIVGGERPDAGTVELAGKRIFALRGRALRRGRRDLQMMFQDPYGLARTRGCASTRSWREPLEIQKVGTRKEQDERITTGCARSGYRRPRSSATRTSSPAASASASASPAL